MASPVSSFKVLDRSRRLDAHLLAVAAVGDGRGLRTAVAEVLGSAEGDDLAAGDDRHPVGEPLRLVHVVGGEDDRLAEIAEAGDRIPGLAPRRGVEPGRRLVEEEQLGVADERHPDVEPPLLAAGQPAGAYLGLLLEADERDHIRHRPRGGVVAAEEVEALAHGQVGIEAAALEDDPDPLAPGAAGPRRVVAEDRDLAGVAAAVALEDLDRRRLPGAVRPEDREHLAGEHLEVDAAQRLEGAVALAQPAHADHRVHHTVNFRALHPADSYESQLDVAVLDPQGHVLAPVEGAADPVGDGDRSVAPAGAADRDRQVALALGDVGRDQELEQRQQAAVELARLGAGLDVLADRLVEPGQGPQLVDVVWIRQEADVEGQVGVARRPVLETEGEQGERELAAAVAAEQLLGDPTAKGAAGQIAGVHDDVGAGPQRRQQLALGPYPLDDPALGSERMAAAGLLVAVDERLLVGLEEEDLGLEPVCVEVVQDLDQLVEVVAAAHVGDDRGPLDAAARVAEELTEAADHPRRQVVDTEVAAVLEGGDRLRLAGPGVAGDDDHHHLGLGPVLRHPVLFSCSWMSRATLPGTPGTASSSSRLAAINRSGDPKCWRSARLRAWPTPLISSSTDPVIALSRRPRWCSIANRCASSRTRCRSLEASESAARSIGTELPGTNTSSSRLANETTVTPRSMNGSRARIAAASCPLPPSTTTSEGRVAKLSSRLPSWGDRSACSR